MCGLAAFGAERKLMREIAASGFAHLTGPCRRERGRGGAVQICIGIDAPLYFSKAWI